MLDELEEVIESINRDQQKVTHILRSELKGFYDLIHNTVLEVVDIDINAAHEYISQTIQDHFNYNYDVDIKPMHISERLTEQELEEKFVIPLRAPTVVSKQKIQLSLLKPKQERVILPKPVKIQPKAPRKTLHIQNELISPPIPVVEKKIKIQEAKVVKETRHEEVKVSIEDKREEEVPPTTSISNSRMNLLKALTKAKTTFTTPATMEFLEEYPEWPSSPEPDCEDNEEPEDLYEPPQAEPVRKRLGRPKKRSNSSSSSGKSPVVNDEGSSDSWKEKFPPIDPLQDEDIEMEMDDYDQGGFLRIFGLITPEQREILKQRRNERKKRKVTRKNNEKKDFFYGNIDIYEVSFMTNF